MSVWSRSLSLSVHRTVLQCSSRRIMTSSSLRDSNDSDKSTNNSAVIEDTVYKYLAGSRVSYDKGKPRVGYNPFSKGISLDWVAFLSQQRDLDTLIEDQLKEKKMAKLREQQSYMQERRIQMGGELVMARFVVFLEGKVKLYGDDHWYCRETERIKSLPLEKTPGLTVEAADLTDSMLIYEGLENLFQAQSILHLGLSQSSHLDEWGISRLAMIPSLVSLDLSHNSYITERCLIPLQFLPNLQKLNITGIKYFTDQPLALTFLEELLPNCVITADNDVLKTDH